MDYKLIFFALLLSLFLFTCQSKTTLDGFDREKWIADPNGCKAERAELINTLLEQKNKIAGLSDREVIQLLGKPDETNLYRRTQRFLVYFTSNGPACDTSEHHSSRLEIRISALNEANEIIHYP